MYIGATIVHDAVDTVFSNAQNFCGGNSAASTTPRSSVLKQQKIMSRFLWGAFAGATTFGATEFFYNKRKIHIEYQEGQEQQTESQHDPDKAAAGENKTGELIRQP